MRESLKLFWATLAQCIKVVADLVSAVGALARVAKSEAEGFEKESQLLSEQRLAAIERGENPDADA